jgi:transcriptional regulator with PAS, ATPase and Fis domain
VVNGAARSARAQRRLHDQAHQQHQTFAIDAFVGESSAAAATRDVLRKLTQVPFSALIIGGETGTGKGLATRILHYNGLRSGGPLVEINCAALPRELLESEVFGHEAGAFTGAKKRRRGLVEQASSGTLFLDEIAELPTDLQSKLLKVIEDQKVRPLGSEQEVSVDVQFIAASNYNLEARVDEGSFRADLYHRLSVFGITLPSLRDRIDDLDQLVPALVAEYNARSGKCVRQIPDAVWAALKSYDWPGNVRELRNVIERCVLFSESDEFPVQWMQLRHHEPAATTQPPLESDRLILPLDGSMSLEDMDRYIVSTALDLSDFNVMAAARKLGTTRQTLRYRVQKYGIKTPSADSDD